MRNVLRPNYRRARALALEIDALRKVLEEMQEESAVIVDDLKAELQYLEREFSLTGVSSEYDL